MDSRYVEFGWLGYIIFATYGAQCLQIGFYPVPSAGSTIEMLFKRTASNEHSKQYFLNLAAISIGEKIVLVAATLAVIIASLVPVATLLWPPVYSYLWPLFKSPPKALGIASALLLVIGNFITGLAVFTLKKHVTFHHFGETKKLYTGGIFGLVRNPVTLGLVIIYGGFVLALPSVVMIFGFVILLFNSSCRIKMEEHYLERSFGDPYLQYKKRVGKFWPKF